MNIIKELKKGRLYLDGGMGSLIQQKIKNPGPVPELLNLTHPQQIGEIQNAYVQAGANIIISNTFGANRYKMKAVPESVGQVIAAAVEIARKQHPDFVALDIGPIGALIGDLGDLSFEEAKEIFAEMVEAGVKAGVDLVMIETMTDIYEARAAVLAVKENSDLPVIASMSYEANGRTLTGSDPLTVVTILESLGVGAIGINCSTGPEQMLPLIDQLVEAASVPLAVEPNAGLPRVDQGVTTYDIDSDTFSDYMKQIAQKGACILGGCCGTTPEHIKKTIEKTEGIAIDFSWQIRRQPLRVATATKTVVLGEDIRVIGEAINPTANQKLREDLRHGRTTVLKRLALEQKRQGADILDVNVGLPEIDECVMMVKAVSELSQIVDLPLQIDSTKPQVIEAVLKHYNGTPIINSVNGEEEVMAKILPLISHYGACVLGLTMDDAGLPKTMEKRVEIAGRIIKKAKEYGIKDNRVLMDCLVLTASAQQAGVMETLKAVTKIKDQFHVPIVLGVSNISFGLPNRGLINRTFLTMAMAAGLDTPIMKAGDHQMMAAVSAFRALSGRDQGCMAYVSAHHEDQEPQGISGLDQPETKKDKTDRPVDVTAMVVEGLKDEIIPEVQKLLQSMEPMEIVNRYLIPGLDQVGQAFETGDMFLPNLIFSAETVQNAFKEIKKAIGKDEQVSKGTVLLATVQGDVHDIGKNILKVIMENYGYTIIDLGKDVKPEQILEVAKEKKIKLVGLSALMTTTVANMETTVKLLKKEIPDIVIMVGGAVLNEEYAKTIGADYYGKDARAGVEIARKVFQ